MKLRTLKAIACFAIVSALTTFLLKTKYAEELDIPENTEKQSAAWAFDAEAYIEGELPRKKDPYARHAFNIHISNSIAADRNIPDSRNPRCPKISISNAQVSVIISFHNEARSTLLRTVTSVLNRSPGELLREVILVDDFSDHASDGSLLNELPLTRVVRTTKREGLIRARAFGAKGAKGSHLVFLDSHCEVNIEWMSPLVETLQLHPKVLASPIVDVIDLDSFEYQPSLGQLAGGFDWALNFRWEPSKTSGKSGNTHQDNIEPFKSPVLPGGLFMVKKSWFVELGGFVESLDIWGAENIEISIRNWLCGDGVLVVPCSRVGHVFRDRHPYSFPLNSSASTYAKNAKYVVETWFEEYKQSFYDAKPSAKDLVISSIKDNQTTKKRLMCRPFQWFVDVVYPKLRYSRKDILAFGNLRQGNMCLVVKDTEKSQFRFVDCNFLNSDQEWSYLKNGELRVNRSCTTAATTHNFLVLLQKCQSSPEQRWIRKSRLLVHQASRLCLESSSKPNRTLALNACRGRSYSQQWDFTTELQSREDI